MQEVNLSRGIKLWSNYQVNMASADEAVDALHHAMRTAVGGNEFLATR